MKTLIFDQISDAALKYAKEKLSEVIYLDEITEDDFQKAEAVIVRIYSMSKEVIDKMPNLKIIAKHGAGTDNIDKEYARKKGIVVTNTPTANSNSVAELAVALSLAVSRKLIETHKRVSLGVESVSPKDLTGIELTGKRVGLIGLGNIGKRVARIFKNGFETKVAVFDPFLSEEEANNEGIKKVNSLETLLKESDIVSISVPLTKETENMISMAQLKLMKPTAILINTARGKVINEDDLYLHLKNNLLFGAAIDAFSEEPLSKDNKLLSCYNFIGTPHNGANTEDALIRMGVGAVDEIVRVKNGEESLSKVN